MNLSIHAIKIASRRFRSPSRSSASDEDSGKASPGFQLLRRRSENSDDHHTLSAPTIIKRPPMTPRSFTAPATSSWLSMLPSQPEEPSQEEPLDPDTNVPVITVGIDGALLKSSVNTFAGDQHTFRVLVVEDNVILRGLVVKWLQIKGYPYREAVDGRHGVSTFENDGPFDCVLLDLSMPNLDGFAATTEIRMIEKIRDSTKHSRILALTGMSSLEDKTRAFAAGVDGYLVKPVSFKILEDIFHKLGFL